MGDGEKILSSTLVCRTNLMDLFAYWFTF